VHLANSANLRCLKTGKWHRAEFSPNSEVEFDIKNGKNWMEIEQNWMKNNEN
jgi:hypothetical protein